MKKHEYIRPEIAVHFICTSGFLAASAPSFDGGSAVNLGIGEPSNPADALGRESFFDDEY